eukprot:XP_001693044.1 predicted protein [Chlamydomonas reinhardtii]
MDAEDVPLELIDLTEALTCAICKELFDGPVSAPCGHTCKFMVYGVKRQGYGASKLCSMCIRQSLDFAHTNKQKGTCPSCRADCNADQLRRVDAVRLAISALPRAAAAVHDLRRRLEDSERRQQGAEHELSVARGRSGPGNAVASGAAAKAVVGAGGAAHQPDGGCSHELAEAPTRAVAGSISGRPRRGAAQQQASQPPARSTRQLARQAQGGRSSKRRAVGDAGTRRAAGGEESEDEEDDKSDFEEVSDMPSRPPTEVKVPPAHAWHSMTDKAARKIMAGIGLPTIGDKNDWSSRYNRYRTFLRTERDRCTTLTMDQLLRAFLQKEQQEDAGRRCGLEVSLARGAWLLTRQ